MTTQGTSRWTAEALKEAASVRNTNGCETCQPLRCPGWEALSGTFPETSLTQLGTLRQPDTDAVDATLDEYHPARTNYWSADAPIAIDYHPYNRCDVWACSNCARVFLRYTEYGGYYVEPRIRAVDPARVVEPD